MTPLRIVFFLLALSGLVLTGELVSHALASSRDYDSHLARADKAMKALDAFEFDKSGNVPADKRDEFETTQRDLQSETMFLKSASAQQSFGVTYGSLAGAATVLFLVLGVVTGRKKNAAPPAQDAQRHSA